MGGLSKKRVTGAREFTVKDADARTMRHVRVVANGGEAFMQPVAYGDSSYVMETYREACLSDEEYVDFVVPALKSLWHTGPPYEHSTWMNTRQHIVNRFSTDLGLPEAATSEMWFGTTHGDPTRENMMRHKSTGAIVLIDPLPPRPYAPNMPILDCAKVVQSLLGWDGPPALLLTVDDAVRRLGFNDLALVAQFVDLQLRRIVPYVKRDSDHDRLMRTTRNLEAWRVLF